MRCWPVSVLCPTTFDGNSHLLNMHRYQLVYGGFSQTKCGLIESATAARESQRLFPT